MSVMFSEVIPFLWELFCDLCIEVQGVIRSVRYFYRKNGLMRKMLS